MKRIIVEGPDGSGKTTLINSLQQEFPQLTRVRNDLEDKQDFDEWWLTELNYEWDSVIPIHDRFYYSELVYGPILRGKVNGDLQIHAIVRKTLRAEALLIYTRPVYRKIREGIQQNLQMSGVSEHLKEIVESYDRLFGYEDHFYGRRMIMFDYSYRSDFNSVVRRVEEYLTGDVE